MHRSEEEKEVTCCSENTALQKKGLLKLITKNGKKFLEKREDFVHCYISTTWKNEWHVVNVNKNS